MIRSIDFLLPNTSQYEVLHHFTKKLCEAAQRSGINSRLLGGKERHEIPLEDPPDLFIGFNGVYRVPTGEYISDLIQRPFLSILIDPAFHYYEIAQSLYTIIACDDRDSCKALQQAKFNKTFFLPHGVERELGPLSTKKPRYDVVMFNTFIDYEARRDNWKQLFPKGVPEAMDLAVELTFSDHTLSFMDAFQAAFNGWMRRGGMVDPRKLNFFKIFEELELYIKGKDRIEVLRSLEGVNVHVWGGSIDEKSWMSEFYASDHIIPHGPIPYEEAVKIIQNSKIVLSSNIKNRQGMHERILTGMAVEAVVATNRCPYMEECFKDKQEIFLYDPQNYASLNEGILQLLKDEPRHLSIGKAGRTAVMKSHTWDHRIKQILEALQKEII